VTHFAHRAVRVTDESCVGEARRASSRAALEAGLEPELQSAAAIAASELATNLLKHAREGEIIAQAHAGAVDILSLDKGPGIANLERALTDGYSTAGTSGTGLGAVRRQASYFDVYSLEGRGTAVLARVGKPARSTSAFEWGAVCVPAPGEEVCGDACGVNALDDELMLVVADGLGHGSLAAVASSAVLRAFDEHGASAPSVMLKAAHVALASTRGAAVAAMRASARTRKVAYAGIGNIEAAFVSDGKRNGLVSFGGIVGGAAFKARELEYAWPMGGVLVLHSDGLQSRWSLESYPGLLRRHPSLISAVLYRDFRRGRDDVTVLTLRTREAQ